MVSMDRCNHVSLGLDPSTSMPCDSVGAFTLVAFRLYDYAGFVVASGGTDLTIWLLLAFVVANLVMAAGETHMWYLHKFDTYPINRYVIIPFVY
ncbi:Polyprenol reductase 2 [Linum perenne]